MKQAVVTIRIARRWPWLALLAGGCDRAVVLNPKGPIADAERGLLIDAFTVMMIVIVPVIVMAFLFAWRYRASNRNARYEPTWAYSAKIDAVVWLVPALIVIAVAVLVWRSTHKLDPYREIASSTPAARRPGRGAGLEVAVHLSRAGHRVGEPAGHPGRPADQPAHHLRHGDEFLLRAGAGRPDLRHGRHADPPADAGRRARQVRRPQHPVQRRRLLRPVFRGAGDLRRPISTPGSPRPSRRRASSTPPTYAKLAERSRLNPDRPTIRRSSPSSSIRSSTSTPAAIRRMRQPSPAAPARR